MTLNTINVVLELPTKSVVLPALCNWTKNINGRGFFQCTYWYLEYQSQQRLVQITMNPHGNQHTREGKWEQTHIIRSCCLVCVWRYLSHTTVPEFTCKLSVSSTSQIRLCKPYEYDNKPQKSLQKQVYWRVSNKLQQAKIPNGGYLSTSSSSLMNLDIQIFMSNSHWTIHFSFHASAS